jgi:diguanylate cyclase (GGDEF)-like protein/PAS domain S-box-containing protein
MSTTTATVLIVDDELFNRKLLEALLRPEGYLTVSAASGEEALTCVAQQAPDLILLDIMMPGMDGYQVARILKASPATSNIPIIMVTAHNDRDARLAGLEAGAEDFLTKPVDRAELWLRVRNLLRLKSLSDFLQQHSWLLEQQVKAQVEARTAELQRFRTAMDATADAIFLQSRASMRYIEVNTTACKMLGYTRAELLDSGPLLITSGSMAELEDTYDSLIVGTGENEVAEVWLHRKDGSQLLTEVHRQAQRCGEDWIIVGVVRDITERKEVEKRLHHLAHYDALTGLPNRVLFYESLVKILARAAESGWDVVVVFIDLDHFKNVNDLLGHAVGDELLAEVGRRLTRSLFIRDVVGRLGGDEFALILPMKNPVHGATIVAAKIRAALLPRFVLHGHSIAVTASIGIAIHHADASEPEMLLKYADTAMYRAKQAGRDTYRFFTAQMNEEVMARLDLEEALRSAIRNSEFVLHYQPKLQLKSGQITGVEALLRWQRPGHGLVPPNAFIPLLEETGLIVDVGRWVIATACAQIGNWMRSPIGPVQISVNVSGRQLLEGDLVGDVATALSDNGIKANLLELELTESSLMANTERTIATLDALKAVGVDISIDDFGTGYSSLAYLRRFPIDALKIDIAFIRDITNNADAAAIVLAIIRMSHILKLDTIAEGVETEEQMAYLRRHRCDFIQGYYFSRPLPVLEVEKMLHEKKCLPKSNGKVGKRAVAVG